MPITFSLGGQVKMYQCCDARFLKDRGLNGSQVGKSHHLHPTLSDRNVEDSVDPVEWATWTEDPWCY